jgi:hypothetical protein
MSDPLDAALRGLRGQRPPTPFAPPEAVRRRGRQRSTHQAMAAGVAVLAVVGGTAGWFSAYRQSAAPDFNPPGATTAPPSSAAPTPSQTASPTPSATKAPSGTRSPYLTAADLGAGNWIKRTSHDLFTNGHSVWSPPQCPPDREDQHPTTRGVGRGDFDAVVFNRDMDVVSHAVEKYAPGTTDERLNEIRAQLQRCSRTTAWNDESKTAPTRYIVKPLDGIGDEAFLVRSEAYTYQGEKLSASPTYFTLSVVLRVGDRVATVQTSIMDEGYARTLATKAAERLR